MTRDVNSTKNRDVVPHQEWLAARRVLLEREKEFTRPGDEISRLRRALGKEVTREYVFEGPGGTGTATGTFTGTPVQNGDMRRARVSKRHVAECS